MKKILLLGAMFMAFVSLSNAQIKTPPASPLCKINQEVGLIRVDVEYSRPSAKGRRIYGELVPFGQMWRTGANASTKITLSDDASIGGVAVKKGTYAIYATPGEKDWTIIIYKNTEFWGVPGDQFKEEDVAAKFTSSAYALRDYVETLTLTFANLRNNGADLELNWENTRVVIPITVDTDGKVMSTIKSTMDGPAAGDYYSAARYYYEEKKDLAKALEWVDKSLEKGGEKFWILRLKGNILSDLGRYKDAVATFEKSTALAVKEGNTDYPRMNEKSIADAKKRM